MRVLLAVALAAAFFVSAVPVQAGGEPVLGMVCRTEAGMRHVAEVAQDHKPALYEDVLPLGCTPLNAGAIPARLLAAEGVAIKDITGPTFDWAGGLFSGVSLTNPDGSTFYGIVFIPSETL